MIGFINDHRGAYGADIQRVFDANFGVYGVRKVWPTTIADATLCGIAAGDI